MTNTETTPCTPLNPTTGKGYSGSNVATLVTACDERGWETAEFAGYHQWKKAGRQVVEKGPVYLIRMIPVKDRKTGKPVLNKDGTPKLSKRTLKVFNVAQTLPQAEADALKAERDAAKAEAA